MACRIIEQNPNLKKPAMIVLAAAAAEPGAERTAIEERAAESWQPSFRQSPSATVEILVREGLLTQETLVDGQPYAGDLEAISADESVPDDAQVSVTLRIAEAGEQARSDYAPEATIAALLSAKPRYADVFQAAVRAAAAEGGCGRMELEAAINQFPQLAPDERDGQTKVYPQFFIDALESAGAIAWDGAWRATPAGAAMLA